MQFTERLRKNDDFRSVYRKGRSSGGSIFVLFIKENGLPVKRLGISVSKKVGNSVVRHRVKRLFRECYRLHEEMFRDGLDIVVLAREGAAGSNYSQIDGAFLKAAKKIRLISSEKNSRLTSADMMFASSSEKECK